MKKLTETAKRLLEASENRHSATFEIVKLPRFYVKPEFTPENEIEFTPATPEETAACIELKVIAKRAKFKGRKEKYILPEFRKETARRFVEYIIKRLEFPRYGMGIAFVERGARFDREDARQAGLKACYESGFFTNGFTLRLGGMKKNGKRAIQFSLLARIRNAIQGQACLRLQCQSEIGFAEIAEVSDKAGFTVSEETVSRRLTIRQVAKARDVMKILRGARFADKSKRAHVNFRTHRGFFLMTLGLLTERTSREIDGHLFKTKKTRFLDYLASGLQAVRNAALLAYPATPEDEIPFPTLGDEIMQALASRFL